MRTLSPSLISELGLVITRPGFLVQLGFSSIQRLSTMGTVTWGGFTWVGTDVRIESLRRGTGAAKAAQVSVQNSDLAYGALVLSEGVSDKAMKIYSVYAGAPADAVLEFDGVGDSAEVGERVVISMLGASTQASFAPRRRISAATGFNTMLPAGTVIRMGTTSYTLERST